MCFPTTAMESGAVEPANGPAKVVMVKPGDGTGVGGGAARAVTGTTSASAKHDARAERWKMNGSKGERIPIAMISSPVVLRMITKWHRGVTPR